MEAGWTTEKTCAAMSCETSDECQQARACSRPALGATPHVADDERRPDEGDKLAAHRHLERTGAKLE